ncbi:MAG: hypothetical protein AAF682_24420 [Planctomycetota bacterium]
MQRLTLRNRLLLPLALTLSSTVVHGQQPMDKIIPAGAEPCSNSADPVMQVRSDEIVYEDGTATIEYSIPKASPAR